MAERDDRAGNDRIIRIAAAESVDKGLVDLQRRDGEPTQVAEAGIAGAEIINGEADAEAAKRAEILERLLRIFHDHALGRSEERRVGKGCRAGRVWRSKE